MGESSLPITVVPEAESRYWGTTMRCRWFHEEIVRSCAAWSIRANDDNDNHINDDNAGRAHNNRAKRDFEANFNTALFQLLHGYIAR